jgi:hypothetical protein
MQGNHGFVLDAVVMTLVLEFQKEAPKLFVGFIVVFVELTSGPGETTLLTAEIGVRTLFNEVNSLNHL